MLRVRLWHRQAADQGNDGADGSVAIAVIHVTAALLCEGGRLFQHVTHGVHVGLDGVIDNGVLVAHAWVSFFSVGLR